ncbi:MAG: ISAs1 family transposase [Candidatus Dormibacteraceae bacterium]
MQSSAVAVSAANVATTDPPACPVSPCALLAAFAQVPDPRRRQGTRYRLAAILALAVAAILANHLSVLAIAQWGRDQDRALLAALGFPLGATPQQSTLQRLFAKLNPDRLGAVLCGALAPTVPVPVRRGAHGIAVDGKAQRGRLAADPTAGVVHTLSAVCHTHGVVLAQAPITHAQEKAAAELTVAPSIIASLDWHGRVFTGDALYCQRSLCQQIVAAGGDYLLLVKGNQPTLHEDIRLLFAPPEPMPLTDRREVVTVESGHGRTDDTRHLIASTDLVGYLDWPGHAQVFQLERTWQARGKVHHTIRHGMTSLPPACADPARLLALKRGHWRVENDLHRPKDVVLGEDASLIHRGTGPDVMAILRSFAVSLLHAAGISTIAAHLRHFSCHPTEVARFLVDFSPQNA